MFSIVICLQRRQTCLHVGLLMNKNEVLKVQENPLYRFNPFPHKTNLQQTTLNTSYQKHKQISIYMKVDKVDNHVAKGEIACFEQFLLLTHCFQKFSAAEASESVCRWERVKWLNSVVNYCL